MDQWHAVVAAAGFAAGYWARQSLETKPEQPACHCQCQWSGPVGQDQNQSGQGSTVWAVVLVLVIFAVLVLSNVALVCKVTLKDSSTGTDREIQINVKGKSKGIHGAQRGLALTG